MAFALKNNVARSMLVR